MIQDYYLLFYFTSLSDTVFLCDSTSLQEHDFHTFVRSEVFKHTEMLHTDGLRKAHGVMGEKVFQQKCESEIVKVNV